MTSQGDLCIYLTYRPEQEKKDVFLLARYLEAILSREEKFDRVHFVLLDYGQTCLTDSQWIGPIEYYQQKSWPFLERVAALLEISSASTLKWQPVDDHVLLSSALFLADHLLGNSDLMGVTGDQFRFRQGHIEDAILDLTFSANNLSDSAEERLLASTSNAAHSVFRRGFFNALSLYPALSGNDASNVDNWHLGLLFNCLMGVLGKIQHFYVPLQIRRDVLGPPKWVGGAALEQVSSPEVRDSVSGFLLEILQRSNPVSVSEKISLGVEHHRHHLIEYLNQESKRLKNASSIKFISPILSPLRIRNYERRVVTSRRAIHSDPGLRQRQMALRDNPEFVFLADFHH